MAAYLASPAGIRVNTTVLAFTLVAGLVVCLRLFTRFLLVRKAGFEDICITVAMVLSVGLTVTIAEQVQNGMGKHIAELKQWEIINSQKAFWASIWIYNLALTTTKISILVQYLRIFPIRKFRIVCCVMIGIVAIYGTWTLFGSIFLCFPVEFFWDKSIAGGRCLNQYAVWFTNGGMNIAQDIAILILPMPVLRSLRIPKGQKKALIVVFALGAIVCIISIVRLQTLVAISNSSDPTFDNPPAATSSAVETNVGIVCACLPAMRPLLHSMMPQYFPDASRYATIQIHQTHDEEQPKHIRTPSASSRPYTAGNVSRSGHSRTGSNAASSRNDRELDNMSDLGPRAHSHARNGSQGPEQRMHPLRMSPFSPPIAPRLPRLPENMATIGAVEPALRSARVSRHSRGSSNPHTPRRTSRITVFQKPLPITPFPIIQ